MELKEVLLIEDNQATASKVESSLEEKGIVVYVERNDAELEERFIKNPGIQIVVLDWLLDGESSVLARLCLEIIKKNKFVPVVIWSEEISKFEEESNEVQKIFPSSCLRKYSKDKVQAGDLVEILNAWQSTPPMSIFSSFKESATRAIDQSFYNLATHSADDLEKGLKSLFTLEKGQTEIDIEHPIDVFTRMIRREIYLDNDFTPKLSDFLSSLDFTGELSDPDKKIKSGIQNYYMYYQPRSEDYRIRSGDIVEISYKTDGGDVSRKAIVITPACDLANPGKTEFLRLLSIYPDERPKDKKGQAEWPFLDEGEPQVVRCHDIVILRNESYRDANNRKAVMIYEHEYHIATNTVVDIKRIKRLDDPYRADLIHRFTSHAGRIGVPGFDAT